MSGAWVLLTISSYAALLLLRRNAPLLHRLAIQTKHVCDSLDKLKRYPTRGSLTGTGRATFA